MVTAPTFQAGLPATAAQLNILSALLNQMQANWTLWTPQLTAATTNPNLGSGGSTAGAYIQIGKTVHMTGVVQAGSSGFSAGSGVWAISLPVPQADSTPAPWPVLFSPNGSLLTTALGQFGSATTFNLLAPNSAGSNNLGAVTNAATPGGGTLANGLYFRWRATYQSA